MGFPTREIYEKLHKFLIESLRTILNIRRHRNQLKPLLKWDLTELLGLTQKQNAVFNVPMGTWTKLPSSLRGGVASAVCFRSPKPECKPSGGDDSIGIAGNAPVISDRSLGALEEYGRLRAVLKRRVRVEGGIPEAVTLLDHGRLCPLAVETDAEAVFSVDKGSFVPIGERTSDNGVRVRHEGFSRCAAGFPYIAGCLAVPAPSADRPCRAGDTGGGRERPPYLDCLDRQCGLRPCA